MNTFIFKFVICFSGLVFGERSFAYEECSKNDLPQGFQLDDDDWISIVSCKQNLQPVYIERTKDSVPHKWNSRVLQIKCSNQGRWIFPQSESYIYFCSATQWKTCPSLVNSGTGKVTEFSNASFVTWKSGDQFEFLYCQYRRWYSSSGTMPSGLSYKEPPPTTTKGLVTKDPWLYTIFWHTNDEQQNKEIHENGQKRMKKNKPPIHTTDVTPLFKSSVNDLKAGLDGYKVAIIASTVSICCVLILVVGILLLVIRKDRVSPRFICRPQYQTQTSTEPLMNRP